LKRHVNPYRINDPTNIFEVGDNSSHPELDDKKRIWKFRGRRFNTATELEKYMRNEGLNPKAYWMKPYAVQEIGKKIIIIEIIERCSPEERSGVRNLAI
jgi:hypothetical protein